MCLYVYGAYMCAHTCMHIRTCACMCIHVYCILYQYVCLHGLCIVHMCVCICILCMCACISVHVCMCVFMHVCVLCIVHVCVCGHVFIVYMYMYYAYVYMCIFGTCLCVLYILYVCARTHVYHVCMYAHIHVHMRLHAHVCMHVCMAVKAQAHRPTAFTPWCWAFCVLQRDAVCKIHRSWVALKFLWHLEAGTACSRQAIFAGALGVGSGPRET